jgi:hypothetical protein
MLASVGVTAEVAESTPTLPAIRRINDHLREVVGRRHFSVACAVLALAESTIQPSFPILAAIARRAFPDIDMTFFDRHGPRDEGHSDDASILFAVSADSSHFATVEAEVNLDLDYRSELFDEWMWAMNRHLSFLVSGSPAETPSRTGASGDGRTDEFLHPAESATLKLAFEARPKEDRQCRSHLSSSACRSPTAGLRSRSTVKDLDSTPSANRQMMGYLNPAVRSQRGRPSHAYP